MSKRMIAAALAAWLLLGFSGCARKPTPTQTSRDTTPAIPTRTIPTTQPQPTQSSFQELVLLDSEDCLFAISAMESGSDGGTVLQAYLENRTDDTLMFSLENASVNGYMCDPFWASEVRGGMKANSQIRFSGEDFRRAGIAQVTDITFTLHVYDSENWQKDSLVREEYVLYPMGESEAKDYPREAKETDRVLFDTDSCAMIVTEIDPEGMWGYTLEVYLENRTDDILMFSIDGASVNGFMCDPFWAETVAPGKKSITTVSWSRSALEENGITQVEQLTLPIRVYDSEDWQKEDYVNQTCEITP